MSPEEQRAITVARDLIAHGIPVFAAAPALVDGVWDPAGGTGGCGYWLPKAWDKTVPSENWLDPTAPGFADRAWRPGWALGAVMGHGLDLLDVDPRNGGDMTRTGLIEAGMWPRVHGKADTPSGGTHEFIASLHVGSRDAVRRGLDVKGGLPDGTSRGFAWIAPTVKLSKVTGEVAPYRWIRTPDLDALADSDDDTGESIAELVRQARTSKPAPTASHADPQSFLTSTGWQHTGAIDDGSRHAALVAYAGSLRRRDVHLDEAQVLMERRWHDCAQPPRAATPLPLSEALDKLRDVYGRYSPAETPVDPHTTVDGAESLAAPLAASWAPVDLTAVLDGSYEAPAASLLTRTDGQSLLYAGATHSLHGESESGKSLLIQIEAVQHINDGRDVLYIDFESDAASVANRLVTFGAKPDAILEHLVYLRPESDPRANAAELAHWRTLLTRRYALAVIDGVTDCLGVFGYATKDNDDLVTWHRAVPRTIADRTGAAVVLIDHVTKDTEGRGRFAIGGQAKMNALTGAAYTVQISEPLGRGLRGVVVLRVAKDRLGSIRPHCGPFRQTDRTQEAARIVIDSRDPAAPVVTIEPPTGNSTPATTAGVFRPTWLMEQVSLALEANPGMTKNAIAEKVGKNKKQTLNAVDVLVAEGHLTVEEGPRNAQLHTAVRMYRQVLDPSSDRYQESGTGQWSNDPVTGSGSYTLEPGTAQTPVPEPLPEPVGTAQDQGSDEGRCAICNQPCQRYGDTGSPYCTRCQQTYGNTAKAAS